jgi:hypothetical protein
LTAASTGTPFTAEEPRPNHKINNRLHRKLDKLAHPPPDQRSQKRLDVARRTRQLACRSRHRFLA